MKLKTHIISIFLVSVCSVAIIDLAFHVFCDLNNVHVEHVHDFNGEAGSTPEFTEENVVHEYLKSVKAVTVTDPKIQSKISYLGSIVNLYEQSILVPPPDFS